MSEIRHYGFLAVGEAVCAHICSADVFYDPYYLGKNLNQEIGVFRKIWEIVSALLKVKKSVCFLKSHLGCLRDVQECPLRHFLTPIRENTSPVHQQDHQHLSKSFPPRRACCYRVSLSDELFFRDWNRFTLHILSNLSEFFASRLLVICFI